MKTGRLSRTRNRAFFHAPAELAAARDTIERLISRYDLERDMRHVFEAWLELRKRGLVPTDTMLQYLDQVATHVVRPAESADANSSPIGELISAWRGLFGARPCTAHEAIEQSFRLGTPEAKRLDLALRKVFAELGRPLIPRALGSWLRAHERRSFDGFGFVSVAWRDHVKLWKVAAMK